MAGEVALALDGGAAVVADQGPLFGCEFPMLTLHCLSLPRVEPEPVDFEGYF